MNTTSVKETAITELIVKRINSLCTLGNTINHKRSSPYRICRNGAITDSTLWDLLNGTTKDTKLSTISKICKGLNISIREFFDDDLFN